jgi:hypothetical protein
LVLANTTAPGSTLKKKSNAIAYHFVWKGCAHDEWQTTYINTDKNVDGLLTKPLVIIMCDGEEERIMTNLKGFEPLLAHLSRVSLRWFFLMISQWGIWVWWFPNVTQWGLGIFFIDAKWGRLYWFGFGVQSKWERNSLIGLRGVLNGTILYALQHYSQYGYEWVWGGPC